jgi:two-component system nitrogen regulation sensor histidine kinase NtrY
MGSSPQPSFYSRLRTLSRFSNLLPYEKRLTLFSVLPILPVLLCSVLFLWQPNWPWRLKLLVMAAGISLCLLPVWALRKHIRRPLQTLANVVGALRDEDYSLRVRGAGTHDAFGELALEINALADLLMEYRGRSIEATALLRHVVEEIDAPVFAFDPDCILRLINSAGQDLLQKPAHELLGRSGEELGLEQCLRYESAALVKFDFGGAEERWLFRRSSFRQQGVPHTLLVMSNVSRALREEERTAWLRLLRVLGHELNNSLTPIKSIAGSLSEHIEEVALDSEQRQYFKRGLDVIGTRAASLNRFLQAYRNLSQMPAPLLRRVLLSPILARVVALETRIQVNLVSGPEVSLLVDADQLEQMLINLVRNGVEAALERSSSPDASTAAGDAVHASEKPDVSVYWYLREKDLLLTIQDNGRGVLNSSNLFVPFYTTKPSGAGIGLVLSRQIAEAHGGSIQLTNRKDSLGCLATIVLPRLGDNS